jgi:hypothetical protein
MLHRAGHGKKGNYEYIPTRLNVCPLALLIAIAKAILIVNHLVHILKRTVSSDDKTNPGYKLY